MADVLKMAPLGVSGELRRTAADTGGELIEFDVVGRARGFLAQPHVHTGQAESYEVIDGTMRLDVGGRKPLLQPGETMSVAPGAAHAQRPGDRGSGRVRVQVRPAGTTEAFLRR